MQLYATNRPRGQAAGQCKAGGQKAIHSICQLTVLLYAAEHNKRQSDGRLAEKVHFKDIYMHTY